MPHSHVAGTAVFSTTSPITANPPGGAGSDQTGKLLLFISQTTSNGAAVTTPPTGYTRIDGLTELAAFYKHGSASEPAASVSYAGSAAGGAQIIAFTSSTGSWASGASVLAGYTERSPANGNDLPYSAMTKVADGNLRVRVAGKNGTTVGITITSVAVTSGYTQCAFVENSNAAGGVCMAAEYQDVAANAVDTDAVITTWAVSRPRRGVTIEFVPAASGPAVTAADGTVQIGEAGLTHAPVSPGTEVFTANPAFAGTINGATLDPDGAAIDITSLLSSLSTTNATLTAPDVSVFRVGGAWNAIRWGVNYEIEFTDGTDTARVNCMFTAPVPTRFGAIVSPDATYHPGDADAGDESYPLWLIGEGPHNPANGATSANVFEGGVASFLPMAYDLSEGAWIEGTVVPFADPASGGGAQPGKLYIGLAIRL